MRSLVFRFEDIATFSDALAETGGSLPLPPGESVLDGEWVLAIFEIGSRRRATAAAARGIRAAGDHHLEFERRDWERLQGFVAARSESMRAARPVGASPPGAMASVSEAPPASNATGIESSRVPFGARVLFIDRGSPTRDQVHAMLVEVGVNVEAVSSAEAAWEQLPTGSFAAVVLDLHAPGGDSFELVRALRREPSSAALPVLLLCALPSSRDAVEAFASGADDFLAKPLRAPELGARLFGLLRRGSVK